MTAQIATKKLMVDCLSTHVPGGAYRLHTDFRITAETNFADSYTVLLTVAFRVIKGDKDQVKGEVVVAQKWVDSNLFQLPPERIDQMNYVAIPAYLLLFARPLIERLLTSIDYPGYPIPAQDFRAFLRAEKKKQPPVPQPVQVIKARNSECAA
jgi:preprotein translocase subunit SecB